MNTFVQLLLVVAVYSMAESFCDGGYAGPLVYGPEEQSMQALIGSQGLLAKTKANKLSLWEERVKISIYLK